MNYILVIVLFISALVLFKLGQQLFTTPLEAPTPKEIEYEKSYYYYNGTSFQYIAEKIKQLPTKTTEETFKDTSQCQHLSFIIDLLGGKLNGYFIDLAANNWYHLSNSYPLEKHFGWTGLCVEPLPSYRVELLSKRTCEVVVNPIFSDSTSMVKFTDQNVFGGIVASDMDNNNNKEGAATFDLQTVTLDLVLSHVKAPNVIDYMSLDVEGAELHVMMGFNFSKYKILIITVERPKLKLHKLLTRNGYWFLMPTPTCHFGDMIYIHESIAGFKQTMNKYRTAVKYTDLPVPEFNATFSYVMRPSWPVRN